MDNRTLNHYRRVMEALLDEEGARQAVLFVDEKRTIRATRRLYGKARRPSRRQIEVHLTDGPPNYREREIIKRCRKAGAALPKAVQAK